MENTAVFIGHRYLPDEAAWRQADGPAGLVFMGTQGGALPLRPSAFL